MSTIDKIRLKGVDYDIAGGGGGSVDAYTKTESDERYAPKGEFASVSGDVENALGEIAALGIDKQDKLSGNYLSKVEVGGSSLSIETKAYKDESVQKTDNINFKTINGQAIFGMGNIQIDGGGGELPDKEVVTNATIGTANFKDTPVAMLNCKTYNLKNGAEGSVGTSCPVPIICDAKGNMVQPTIYPFAICVCTQSTYDAADKNPNILYIING